MGNTITPRVSFEEARGCGFRKDGGIYLVGAAGADGCGKLPVMIPHICPTCGEGIRPSRAPRLLADPASLWNRKKCPHGGNVSAAVSDLGNPAYEFHASKCDSCPLGQATIGQALIVWVGERFYPTPSSYVEEARRMGISRRIASIPRGFKVGEDYVLLAHRKCFRVNPVDEAGNVIVDEVAWIPGIIGVFKPERIEIVVTAQTSQEELQRYAAQGLTPVIVNRVGDGKTEEEGDD